MGCWWRCADGALLVYGNLDETFVPPVETQSIPVQEKSQEDYVAPTGASNAQGTANNLALKPEKMDEKQTVAGIMVKTIKRKCIGFSEILLPSLCGLSTAQL